jgi:hypothetical protein
MDLIIMDNFINEDRLLDLWLEEYFEEHEDTNDEDLDND